MSASTRGGLGPQGFRGPKGEQGPTGSQGLNGNTGPTGIKGNDGPTGQEGPVYIPHEVYSQTFSNNKLELQYNFTGDRGNGMVSDVAINSTQNRMVIIDNSDGSYGIFLYTRNSKTDTWSSPVNFFSLSSAGTGAEGWGLPRVPFYNLAMSASGDKLVATSAYTRPRVFKWNSNTLTYDLVGTVALDGALGVRMSGDGSRIILRPSRERIFFATWNDIAQTYTNITLTLEPTHKSDGENNEANLAMSTDGSRIAYGSTTQYGYANWNGTNYSTWIQIPELNNLKKCGGTLNEDGNVLLINSTQPLCLNFDTTTNKFSSPIVIPSTTISGMSINYVNVFSLGPNSSTLYWTKQWGSNDIYSTDIQITKNDPTRGTTGPTGQQGPTGPQGPTGQQGLEGKGFVVHKSGDGYPNSADFTGHDGKFYLKKGGDLYCYIPGTTGSTGAQRDLPNFKYVGDVTDESVLQGPQGFTGPSGIQGLKGDTGIQGFTGPAGIQGFTGPAGIQGLKGDTGQPGTPGDLSSLCRTMTLPLTPSVIGGSAYPTVMDSTTRNLTYDGWYYKKNTNTSPTNKINWYFTPNIDITLADIKQLYFEMKLIKLANFSEPFIMVYTKTDTVTANAASWYKSRRTYEINKTKSSLTSGANYCCYVNINGSDSPPFSYDHNSIPLEIIDTTANKGTFAANEKILYLAVSSNSAAPIENVEFICKSINVKTTKGTINCLLTNDKVDIDALIKK